MRQRLVLRLKCCSHQVKRGVTRDQFFFSLRDRQAIKNTLAACCVCCACVLCVAGIFIRPHVF